MEKINSNIIRDCNISQNSYFIDNTSYNPFAPNQNTNKNISQNNLSEYKPIIRPYLNEIKNEEPKNVNNILNEPNSKIEKDNQNELKVETVSSGEIRANNELTIEYENALRKEIEQTTPLISEKLNIQLLLDDYKYNEEYSNSIKLS